MPLPSITISIIMSVYWHSLTLNYQAHVIMKSERVSVYTVNYMYQHAIKYRVTMMYMADSILLTTF